MKRSGIESRAETGAGPSILDLALGALVAPLAAAAWAALWAAQMGRLTPGWSLAAGAAALAAAALFAALHLARGGRIAVTWLDAATLAAVVLAVWRLLPAVSPWPAFLDASWYLNTGAAMARSRSLDIAAPALEVPREARRALVTTFADQRTVGMHVPDDEGRGFHDVIYSVPDVSAPAAMPYHPPFFAAWVGVWALARGVPGAGAAVLPWSAAYLLALAALARRTVGPAGALAAVLLVAVSPAYAYFGRTPYAETAGGALWLVGAAALAALAGGRARPWLAGLAGLALGLAVLAKIDGLLGVIALLGWWLACRRSAGGVREGLGLLAGLALPMGHGALLAAGASRLYVDLNGGGVVAIALTGHWPALAMVALLGLALIAVAGRRGGGGGRRRAAAWAAEGRGAGTRALDDRGVDGGVPAGRRGRRRGADGLPGAGGGIGTRPWVGRRPRAPSVDGRTLVRAGAFAAIVLLVAAWIRATTAHEADPPAMVVILGWALSPLGVWAAAVGLAKASDGHDPRLGPLLAVALVAVPVVLAEPAVTRSLSSAYTARRLMPYALPVAAVLAASLVPAGPRPARKAGGVRQRPAEEPALRPSAAGDGRMSAETGPGASAVRMDPPGGPAGEGIDEPRAHASASVRSRPGRRGLFGAGPAWGSAAATIAVCLLIGANLEQAAAPMRAQGEFGGGVHLAGRLADLTRPEDVVLFASVLDGSDAGRLAPMLTNLEGRATAVVARPGRADALAPAVALWRGQGRRVLVVADDNASVPQVTGYESAFVDEATVVPVVLAPSPLMPPRWTPYELSIVIHELVPEGDSG